MTDKAQEEQLFQDKTLKTFEEKGHTRPANLLSARDGGWIYQQCATCGVTIFNWSRCGLTVCDRRKVE